MTQEIDTTTDVTQLSYEQSRDQLKAVVNQLESGQLPLQMSMELWEYGEKLAGHCQAYLQQATQKIEAAQGDTH
ncbi:MAG: exodeoxyribonuclease VII small subunit [Actinomycetaceae bacterium]|nr:exodeoxyribonuclease VII small subunit [Actinomycetaceae bacterium]